MTDKRRFSAGDIGEPYHPGPGTVALVFAVTLPGGEVGKAFVNGLIQTATSEKVAAAINFQVEGHGYDPVVEKLKSPEGLLIDLAHV